MCFHNVENPPHRQFLFLPRHLSSSTGISLGFNVFLKKHTNTSQILMVIDVWARRVTYCCVNIPKGERMVVTMSYSSTSTVTNIRSTTGTQIGKNPSTLLLKGVRTVIRFFTRFLTILPEVKEWLSDKLAYVLQLYDLGLGVFSSRIRLSITTFAKDNICGDVIAQQDLCGQDFFPYPW